MKTKIAKLIVDFYSSKGIKDVFLLTGGAIAFMADAVNNNKKMRCIPTLHEQGAAMMSDGYSRIAKKPSLCMATSGPGVTNLITGIACSWYDSTPNIFITGQVRTSEIRSKKNKTKKIRQVGFQETDVISLVKSITKFAYQLKKGDNLTDILNHSYSLAINGRPGPILIDVPIDIQNSIVEKNKINKNKKNIKKEKISKSKLLILKKMLLNSRKPLILIGGGLQENNKKLFNKIIKKNKIPVVNTWNGFDLIDFKNEKFLGTVGIYGNRLSNSAIQNCDLLIVLGSRLETRVIGREKKNFGKNAKIVQIDVDNFELIRKREKKIDLKINSSSDIFLIHFNKLLNRLPRKDYKREEWLNNLKDLKKDYLIPGKEQNLIKKKTNPYIFFHKLSEKLKIKSNIFISTGSTVTWAFQSFKIKLGQRFVSANGHSPMGYALPAAIGGYFADPKKKCICIDGDGSFQLNFQELQTVNTFKIPIKIIIINNDGYGIIRQFQDQNLESKYVASDKSSNVKNPNFEKIARAYSLKYYKISNNQKINSLLKKFLNKKEASILEVLVDRKFNVVPRIQLKDSLEDMSPKKHLIF